MSSSAASSRMALLVLVGALAGIGTGLFLGDYARLLEPVGTAYVQLLAMAVYPYLISSLLHGLGKLDVATSRQMLRRSWYIFVLAWVVVITALYALSSTFPAASHPAVIDLSARAADIDLVSLFIPGNPLASITRNIVPAVVVFAVLYGVAMQKVENKQSYLQIMEHIKTASVTIWGWVVVVAPLGVFSLFAGAAGTLQPHEIGSLVLYSIVFLFGAFFLALWVIPSLVSSLAPVEYRELMGDLREAIVLSMATTLSVVALPAITRIAEKIARKNGVDEANLSEVVGTQVSIAYPFAQLGNLFVMLFFTFCASYFQSPMTIRQLVLLPLLTLLSTIGSPSATVDAVNFLTGVFSMPAGTENLYVTTMALTRYGQVILSVSGFAFVTVLSTLSFYGRLRVNRVRLGLTVVSTLLVFGCFVVGLRSCGPALFGASRDSYSRYKLDEQLTHGVRATFRATSAETRPAVDSQERPLQRLQRTGVLRVGYNASIIPFCYRNTRGDLVGYDVSLMYRLAKDMNVGLEFVPFHWSHLVEDLEQHRFDLAISGIYVTEERIRRLTISQPYLQSRLALVARADRAPLMNSRDNLEAMPQLKVASFDDPVLLPMTRNLFPNREVVVVKDYQDLLSDPSIDAGVWTLIQARSFAMAHTDFTAVVPEGWGNPFMMAYLMPPGADEMRRYLDYWLELRKADGFTSEQERKWVLGIPPRDRAPRWSILRDVLHWVK